MIFTCFLLSDTLQLTKYVCSKNMNLKDLPISKILDVIKDPDLRIKISQLVSENLQLKEENFELKQELEKREELQEIGTSLAYDNNHYYRGCINKDLRFDSNRYV